MTRAQRSHARVTCELESAWCAGVSVSTECLRLRPPSSLLDVDAAGVHGAESDHVQDVPRACHVLGFPDGLVFALRQHRRRA